MLIYVSMDLDFSIAIFSSLDKTLTFVPVIYNKVEVRKTGRQNEKRRIRVWLLLWREKSTNGFIITKYHVYLNLVNIPK